MIAYAGLLAEPAKEAGMKVPSDPEAAPDAYKEEYPHFFVFCCVQLGTPMPSPTAHWENAKVIASLSDEEVRKITPEQLLEKGFQEGYAQA